MKRWESRTRCVGPRVVQAELAFWLFYVVYVFFSSFFFFLFKVHKVRKNARTLGMDVNVICIEKGGM